MNQSIRILIVDDEEYGRETLAALLHKHDYELTFATNGTEALAVAAVTRPDLILLDVMLPEMDGFTVCRELRADPQLAEVPIILVTALEDRDSRLAGLAAGADDFISKPFDRLELRARIRSITHLNRYRRLLHERSKFERVVELAPNSLLILTADGAIQLANPAVYLLLGVPEPDMVGLHVDRFVAASAYAHFARAIQQVIADPLYIARFASTFVRADQGDIPVEVDAGYITWENAPAAQVSVRDISERMWAEAQRQRQLARLSALQAIDQAIASNLDLPIMLDVVVEQLRQHLVVDVAAVLLCQPQSHTLVYSVVHGTLQRVLRRQTVQFGEGYAGQVAVARRMLSLADVTDAADSPLLTLPANYYGVPLFVKGQVAGVLEVFSYTPLFPDDEWFELLGTIAGQTAVAIDHAALFKSLQRANTELALAYDTTLEGWARALELRDKETEGHAQRVTTMALALARAMGLGVEELVHIRRGALLHDIGKMGIPDSILLKPGPLAEAEWEIMRQHPSYAYELLSPIPYLQAALDIPYSHHEKWDGSGYPRGLQGENIPLAARIFAVVDVWDALRHDRPYRPGWSEARVREHLRAGVGTHFDARVVEAFLRLPMSEQADVRLSVLVVDDAQLVQLVQQAFDSHFVIFTATTGEQALEILAREVIAVLLTDQHLATMTGLRLLAGATQVSPLTLGILSANYLDSATLNEALSLGNVRGFLHKPWNLSELRLRVEQVAQQYHSQAHVDTPFASPHTQGT